MKKCIKNETFTKQEPKLEGKEPSGLNIDWIEWYMEKHNCTYGQAVEAGLNRLGQSKVKRKRYKWQR